MIILLLCYRRAYNFSSPPAGIWRNAHANNHRHSSTAPFVALVVSLRPSLNVVQLSRRKVKKHYASDGTETAATGWVSGTVWRKNTAQNNYNPSSERYNPRWLRAVRRGEGGRWIASSCKTLTKTIALAIAEWLMMAQLHNCFDRAAPPGWPPGSPPSASERVHNQSLLIGLWFRFYSVSVRLGKGACSDS